VSNQSNHILINLVDCLPRLAPLEAEKFDRFRLEELTAEVETAKAVNLNGAWIPKSQIRSDGKDLFIARWVAGEVLGNEG